MSRLLTVLCVLLALCPRVAMASVPKPSPLPVETTLQFDHPPRPGEKVDLSYEVTAVSEVHGLAIELHLLSPQTRPTEWLDGLTSEANVLAAPVPWKGDLAAGAHATIKASLILPVTGVYHMQGFVSGKGVTVVGAGKADPLGYYDATNDLWVRVGSTQTVLTTGGSIAWTRQWNSTSSTMHAEDRPDSPVMLSLAFEKLPTLATEGVLLVRLEAREEVPGLALDLEMPAPGLEVSTVAPPVTRGPAGAVSVEPGGATFDVRWTGGLQKGETTTLRVPLRVRKAGWDVLGLYVNGNRAGGLPGWTTHKEMLLVVDDVVSAARERLRETPRKN